CGQKECRADAEAEARSDVNILDKDLDGRWGAAAKSGMVPICTGGCEPDNQQMEGDGDEHDKGKRRPGGFQQHRPKRRREHLSERFDGRVDHRRLPALVPAPWAPSLNKALLWRYRKHGDDGKRFWTCAARVPW